MSNLYAFQGQENDDEIKGNGNSVNYKYRMHDPRLGRFFAIDPLARDYPWNSTYAFSENIVINAVELEGLENAPCYDESSYWFSWIFDFFGSNQEHVLKEKINPLPYTPLRNSNGDVIIENSAKATEHYYRGNGEPVVLSKSSQKQIYNSEDMQYYRNRIKTGKTPSPEKGSGLPVYVENESTDIYHVGRIQMNYRTTCEDGLCTTRYIFSGDGYRDIFTGEDLNGPDGELGGDPYDYKSFYWEETYKNPGYKVNSEGIPEKNDELVEPGSGPPNETSR